MGIDIFFDKVCDIYTNGVTMVNQTQVPTKTILYEKIPCDFGKASLSIRNLRNVNHTLSQDMELFEMVLNGPSYTNLTKGMYVEVFDDVGTLLSQGTYNIVSIDYVKDLSGEIDNVFIGLNAIDDGSF